jgi:hypothetical protein
MDELSETLVIAFMLALVVLIFVGLLWMMVEKAVSARRRTRHIRTRPAKSPAEAFQNRAGTR